MSLLMTLLSDEDIDRGLVPLAGWRRDGAHIERTLRFRDFVESVAFVNRVCAIAEAMGHHPDVAIAWNEVTLTLCTHSEGGLTEGDLVLAARIDAVTDDTVSAAPALIEFPADDPERALRFWGGLLGAELDRRREDKGEGEGWQSRSSSPPVGVHARGRGPGDSVSLPYFGVRDFEDSLQRVHTLGGSVIHPGRRWAICRDSEGSPFALARQGAPPDA